MITQYCASLEFNADPLLKPVEEYGTSIWPVSVPLADLNPELFKFLHQYNIKVWMAWMFYNPPHRVSVIHIDSFGGDYANINFLFGGKGSQMCWYKTNPGVVKTEADSSPTETNTKYISFVPEEVSFTYKEELHSPSIIQSGIPHNIINAAEPRWCLSLVVAYAGTENRIKYSEAVKMLRSVLHR